ncbi:adenylosuccinate lyase [Nonlabens ponticola]|uniref:Adenylosuccinate lyase n=1 Tax=Nonlabens ponticola TaxID=2496866 RepID=A0A3S9MY33_9FLAO|nr:adenylosuccinate lyase [Nonlabens ponticola]AZQ44042.1 adenylosuccinate lyase [Nonlabens ponticola]
MDRRELYNRLEPLKAYKADRVDLCNLVVEYHQIPELIEFCHPKHDVSHQACWVLEQVFLLHEEKCLPHLGSLINLFALPINHSGMRSLLKISLLICQQFYHKKSSPYDELLTIDMRATLLDGCFGELIAATGKSANLIFATKSLYLLGQDFSWVHEQLPDAIEKHLDNPDNKGYRSGAIAIIKKLE